MQERLEPDERADARELRTRYLKETLQIKRFLAAPENADVLGRYQSAADEFQLQVITKRKDHQTFDEVIGYLIDLVFARDPILPAHQRLDADDDLLHVLELRSGGER